MLQTIYYKALVSAVAKLCAEKEPTQVIETLQELNLLDPKRCKAFLVKNFVVDKVNEGMGKTDAMYEAAEKYCCSYECVRKYIYYTYK